MKHAKNILLVMALLVVAFVARLYKIDNPVADWHSWRQADTSAVTRNYFKYGIDLFHPRYDDFSDVSGTGRFNPNGYRFVEFPIFNLLHFGVKSLLPFVSLEVAGRLTAIVCSLVSGVCLYIIVRRHLGNSVAFLSAFFFLFLPYNIYYSRTILPDPLMVTLYLASLNFFDLWIKKPSAKNLLWAAVFGSLSILVKPVAMFFLLPAAIQAWQKYGMASFKKLSLYIFLAIVFVPFLAWRWWELRFPEGMPASWWLLNGNGIRFKGAFFQWIFGERLGSLILGKWGTFPLLLGLAVAPGYFVFWFLSALAYLFTFATGNIQHDYYQIPIIPALAVLLAVGTLRFFKTWRQKAIIVVSLAFMFAFSWYQVRGYYQVNHWEIVHAGQAVDQIVPKDAKVVAPYFGDTAFLYQTNRPGFPFMTMPIKDMKDRYGVMYYVSTNYDDETNAIMNKYIVINKTPEYVIVKLEEPIRP